MALTNNPLKMFGSKFNDYMLDGKVDTFMEHLLKDVPPEKKEQVAKEAIEILNKVKKNSWYFYEEDFEIK